MKKITMLFIIILAGSMMFTGCKKDDPAIVLPSIALKADIGYVSANTQAAFGDTLRFGITAKSNGTDNLVKFTVYVNDQKVKDSTINTQNFVIELDSLKTVLDTEVWKFETKDIAGNVATSSVTITGKFGEIYSYASISLGAQNNHFDKGFLSFSNGATAGYTQAEAFQHQSDIDMFCFYEDTLTHQNYMTLAAPGSGITQIFADTTTSPDKYSVKNLTYFVKTSLTSDQFDAVINDAVVLASFNPNSKFRKAKALAVNDIYAFKLQSGRYGLLKITAVTGVEDGSLQMDVKIQK
ncbi:MAG: hypothetical protein ACOYMF_04360 [Bacteroidales bacterium]